MKTSVRLLLLFLALSLSATSAFAACSQINALPFVITFPGTYCFPTDLSFSGNNSNIAIDVRADDVTIDFAGYWLRQTTDKAGTIAIHTNKSPRNLVIRNGSILDFSNGLVLGYVDNADIRNLIIEDAQTPMQIQGDDVNITDVTLRAYEAGAALQSYGKRWEISRLRVEGFLTTAVENHVDHLWIRDSYLQASGTTVVLVGGLTTITGSDLRSTGEGAKDVLTCDSLCSALLAGNTFAASGSIANAVNISGAAKYRDNTSFPDLKYVGGVDLGGNQ